MEDIRFPESKSGRQLDETIDEFPEAFDTPVEQREETRNSVPGEMAENKPMNVWLQAF